MSEIFEKILDAFKGQELELTVSSGTSDQIIKSVAEGMADVGIVIEEALSNYPNRAIDYNARKGGFCQDSMFFMRKNHRLNDGTPVNAEALQAEKFAWFDSRLSPELHETIQASLRSAGGPSAFRIHYEVTDLETLHCTLTCREAITIMPAVFARYGLPGIVGVASKLPLKLPKWKYSVIRHRSACVERAESVFEATCTLCRSL